MAGPEDQFERVQFLSGAFDPIIDICVLFGVHTAELESLLRVEFVKRVASTLPKNPGKGRSPSHEEVGLAAGLNRGEVQKILSKRSVKSAQARMKKKAKSYSKTGRVLDLWKTTPHYLNTSGVPMSLPIDLQLAGPSFEKLVNEALPGIRHRNVLKDLRRRGLIQLLPDDIVRLPRVARPLPTQLNGKSLSFIADQMKTVGNTLLQNILNAGESQADPLGTFLVSNAISVPEDALGTFRERIATLLQGIERDLSRSTQPKKDKVEVRALTVSVYTASTT